MIAYILIFFMSFGAGKTAHPTVLHFDHMANGQPLEKNRNFSLSKTSSCTIKQLKYYVSHVEIQRKNAAPISVPGVFLIDAFGKDSINVNLPEGNYTAINFSIGVDSSIHLGGAQVGDLDPLNGMYWAWNTGFIHFKLEGEKTTSGLPSTRFQYHIGGFSGVNNTMQGISIPIISKSFSKKSKTIFPHILVNVSNFLNSTVIRNNKPLIMKEGEDAVAISNIFPSIFSTQKAKK